MSPTFFVFFVFVLYEPTRHVSAEGFFACQVFCDMMMMCAFVEDWVSSFAVSTGGELFYHTLACDWLTAGVPQ